MLKSASARAQPEAKVAPVESPSKFSSVSEILKRGPFGAYRQTPVPSKHSLYLASTNASNVSPAPIEISGSKFVLKHLFPPMPNKQDESSTLLAESPECADEPKANETEASGLPSDQAESTLLDKTIDETLLEDVTSSSCQIPDDSLSEALPSELSSCSVCYEAFANEPENLMPRRLRMCDHIACTGCLRDAWDDGEVTCSECFAASQCSSVSDLTALQVIDSNSNSPGDDLVDETLPSELSSCSVCYEAYANEPENLVPRRLRMCDHIACTGCLRDAWDDGEVTCSECFAASQCSSVTILVSMKVGLCQKSGSESLEDSKDENRLAEEDPKVCPVCFTDFADTPRASAPRRLPSCSHLLCTTCLEAELSEEGEACEVTCSECFEPCVFEGPLDVVAPPIQVAKQQLPRADSKTLQPKPSAQIKAATVSKPKKIGLAAFLFNAPPPVSPTVPAVAPNMSANGSSGSDCEGAEEEVRRTSSVAVTRRLSVASTSALLQRFQSTSLGSMREWGSGSEDNADDVDENNGTAGSTEAHEGVSEPPNSCITAEQQPQSSNSSSRKAIKAAAIANARNGTNSQSNEPNAVVPSKALPPPTRIATARPAAAPAVGTGIVRADEMSPVHPFKIAARFLSQRPIDFGDAWEIVERAKAVLQREPNMVRFRKKTCRKYIIVSKFIFCAYIVPSCIIFLA